MSDIAALGWLVAGCLTIITAWAYTDLRDLRTVARERQIRLEEAQAWADEYQRERDALAAECDRLHSQLATLRYLYTERTREALAANYWYIARNVAWRQRGGQ